MGRPDPNGIIMNIPGDYRAAFKGGQQGRRRKQRRPLKGSVRQAARQLLNSPAFTARDEAILETLLGVGLLSREQIQRLFWPGCHSITVSSRLRALYQRHLLHYTPELMDRMRTAGLEPCHLYALGPVGQEILAIRRGLSRSQLHLGQRYDLQRGNPLLMHDLQVSEVYVRARTAVSRRDGQLIWYNEKAAAIRTRTGEELVRPDGAFKLSPGAGAYFLELDRGSTHWPNKVEFYEHAQRSGDDWPGQFRTSQFPPVLAVVPARLLGRIGGVVRQRARSVHFWLKAWPAFLESGFLDGWADALTGDPVDLIPEGDFSDDEQ